MRAPPGAAHFAQQEQASRTRTATAAAARAAGADVALAFYLEGDDGLRWELPEQRDALAAVGIPTVLLDHQPYDLRGVDLDV